jgi:hypothetical protein
MRARGSAACAVEHALRTLSVPGLTGCMCMQTLPTSTRAAGPYIETGFCALFCRHRRLLIGSIMHSGETCAYGISLLTGLMQSTRRIISYCWYDIGPCRFKPYLNRNWLPHIPAAFSDVGAWLRNIKFPLPPFHKWCHVASCQVVNALDFCEGAGTAVGEPPGVLFARSVSEHCERPCRRFIRWKVPCRLAAAASARLWRAMLCGTRTPMCKQRAHTRRGSSTARTNIAHAQWR